MAQGRLMTVEIQGVDLIRSQAPKMNKHEVPSYFGSLPNNTTKGLRSRSIIFGKNPTCQHTTNLSEFIARQVLCRSGSYSRAKCQDFVARYKDDGILYEIDPFCNAKTIISVRQSKSIEDREIGKQFAQLWRVVADQVKILFLEGDDEATLAHKSSALKIEETCLENMCSNLPLLEVDSCLPLIHLICLFLVFLLKCCNWFSLKPTRPMCDGRRFASSPFCRLASGGAFFCGLPLRWVLYVVRSVDSQRIRA